MGHTNATVNYNLPQFVGTDKPSWLGDVNGAFLAIDTAIAAAKTEADSAAGGVASLQNTVGSHTTQIGTLTDTVTAQGGTLNSVTALIGNGTPTTTDQTIIGAINEINARVSGNNFGSYVTIPAGEENIYTTPSDGYVNVYSAYTQTGSIGVTLRDNNNVTKEVTDYNEGHTKSLMIFIRKGTKIWSGYTNQTLKFIPLE